MSRTIKTVPTWLVFRRPAGYRAAVRNHARPAAIPPSDWDDKPVAAYREMRSPKHNPYRTSATH